MGATTCWGLCCHRPPFLTLTGEKKGPGGAVSGGSMPSTCRAAHHLGGSREGASCRGGGWRPPGFESGPHGRWAAAQGQVPAWPHGAGPGRARRWSGVSASVAESGLAEGGAAQWRWGPDATIIPTRNLWGDRGPLTLDCGSLPVGGVPRAAGVGVHGPRLCLPLARHREEERGSRVQTGPRSPPCSGARRPHGGALTPVLELGGPRTGEKGWLPQAAEGNGKGQRSTVLGAKR